MNLTNHLAFDGNCEEAFRFYESCLGGKIITMRRWSDTPMANLCRTCRRRHDNDAA